MPNQTSKVRSEYDETQIIQKVYNQTEGVLATGTFLTSLIGNNIQVAYPNATTEVYSFYEGTTPSVTGPTLLYILTVVYTDSTKNNLSSVTRST
jgi:hypothetical protein